MPSDSQDGSGGRTLVIVGCGSAKRDNRGRRVPARDLYTSTYFEKKRDYAESVGDEWMILSAKHGLIAPESKFSTYDTSIDDLGGDELDALAHQVGMTLIDWAAYGGDVERVAVLAGKRYLQPLRMRDAFSAGVSARVVYPLQQNDLGGIGEQMAWLGERADAADHQQVRLTEVSGC
jgi:hypothetical protein